MQNKTVATEQSVADFITSIEHNGKRADAHVLNDVFKRVTGYDPVMWGPNIIGYGTYHYRYATGREGNFLATGFSPRKANFSIYIMPGYTDFSHILKELGKHKIGKSCLYINKLADIDLNSLERLILAGLENLNQIWPVRAK